MCLNGMVIRPRRTSLLLPVILSIAKDLRLFCVMSRVGGHTPRNAVNERIGDFVR